MAKNRAGVAEGVTIKEVEALLLKAGRQLRILAPPPDAVKDLVRIEVDARRIRARRKSKLALVPPAML